MDTILLTVTTLSLAIAAGLAIVVVKLLHQDRARSEARVAALTAMAVDPGEPARNAAPATTRRVATARPVVAAARPAFEAHADDLEIRPSVDAVAGVSQLFAQPDTRAPWGRRFAAIAALAAIVTVIGFAIARRPVPASATSARSQAASAAAVSPAAVDAAPLELLSLRHQQEPQRLVITGIVQNPRNGAPLTRIVATVVVFRPDGSFATSGRAPLDFSTLSPGVESPFVVSVPVTGAVGRYRIGFRTDGGRVISHVDRRGPDALAQK